MEQISKEEIINKRAQCPIVLVSDDNKTSYFLIFYTGENNKGAVVGNNALEFKSSFPNRKEVTDYIIENHKVNKLVITNIIKLTKVEYDEWCRS